MERIITCTACKNHTCNITKLEAELCFRYPHSNLMKGTNMTTLEMMSSAQIDGKTYIDFDTDDMVYNTKMGFFDKYSGRPWSGEAFINLNELFECNGWHEYAENIYTKAEAEEKFGIKIVG